jgi:acyl-ACP thioesterase
MELQFEKQYRVHVYETGPNGKLNLYSLFNYLQDIASDHAVKLGFGKDDLMKENRFWVLSRIYAIFNEWPQWGSSLILKTWPDGIDKLFALRSYEARSSDGTPVASASSSWLILDLDTKRIQRPDLLLSHFNIQPDREPPVRYAAKLDPPEDNHSITPVYKIKVSDLDVNLHTNNVRYLKWVCDTYDLEFMMNNFPQSAEINYLAESLCCEEIVIKTSADQLNPGFYNHSVVRTCDNKELCRIRIGWNKILSGKN